MSAALPQQVKSFIQRHHLVRPGQQVLVAVSGGADSVALLHALKALAPSLNLRLTVAHLNHQIRGAAADQDAAFVKSLAKRMKLRFAGGKVNVPKIARRSGRSLEMAARKARYAFLEKTALKHKCEVVATAHTADDNIETILLMLIRGCGLQGLTGIAPKTEIGKITVIRPLLETSRKAIEQYLRELKIAWREDASNADLSFLRNRVRHELIPLLEKKYNPGIKNALARLAEVLKEENDFLEKKSEEAWAAAQSDLNLMHRNFPPGADPPSADKDTSKLWAHFIKCAHGSVLQEKQLPASSRPDLNAKVLRKHHLAVRRRVIRRWLLANGLNSQALDFQLINRVDNLIMRPASGGKISLAGELRVKKIYPWLTIGRARASGPAAFLKFSKTSIKIPGTTRLPAAGLKVTAQIGPGVQRERFTFGRYPVKASLSLKTWRRRTIRARAWRAGDRMRPYGMQGSRKLQDIFSDAKVPVALRHNLPVFECNGEIIWLSGFRIAASWQVPLSAKNALHLTVEPA